jgi:hypothetical protein
MRLLKLSAVVAFMLFSAVMLLGVLSLRALPPRGAGVPVATLNGDVNCDGKLDMSDAVYTLRSLFSDGPAPCAIAQEAEVLDQLKALSGQIANLQSSIAAIAKPLPQDIVTLTGQIHFKTPGGTEVLYRVPDDKWLVLTAVTDSSSVPPVLMKRTNGQSTAVPGGFPAYFRNGWSWTTGVAFPPGSEVLEVNPESSRPSDVSFYINGYLVNG